MKEAHQIATEIEDLLASNDEIISPKEQNDIRRKLSDLRQAKIFLESMSKDGLEDCLKREKSILQLRIEGIMQTSFKWTDPKRSNDYRIKKGLPGYLQSLKQINYILH